MGLTDLYLEFWPKIGREIQFSKFKTPDDGVLHKATVKKPRYSRVYLASCTHFSKMTRLLSWTQCVHSNGEMRPIGECASALASLIQGVA